MQEGKKVKAKKEKSLLKIKRISLICMISSTVVFVAIIPWQYRQQMLLQVRFNSMHSNIKTALDGKKDAQEIMMWYELLKAVKPKDTELLETTHVRALALLQKSVFGLNYILYSNEDDKSMFNLDWEASLKEFYVLQNKCSESGVMENQAMKKDKVINYLIIIATILQVVGLFLNDRHQR